MNGAVSIQVVRGLPGLSAVDRIEPLSGGFSPDAVFLAVAGERRHVVRLADPSLLERKRTEARFLGALRARGLRCPEVIAVGLVPEIARCFMIHPYLAGSVGREVIHRLSVREQAEAGRAAGEQLRIIHDETPPLPTAPSASVPAAVGLDPRPDPRLDARPDPRPDPRLDPRPDPRLDPRPDPRRDPRPEARPDPGPEARPDPRPEARLDPRPEARPDPRAEARLDPRAEAHPRPDAPPELRTDGAEAWQSRRRAKHERKVRGLEKLGLRFEAQERIDDYVEASWSLISSSPFRLQHDDFQLGNILIDHNAYAGVIDFGNWDGGDPIEDFYKLPWLTSIASPAFARGQVDGYLACETPADFWPRYNFFIALSLYSSLLWGAEQGTGLETFAAGSEQPLDSWRNGIAEIVETHDFAGGGPPRWYAC